MRAEIGLDPHATEGATVVVVNDAQAREPDRTVGAVAQLVGVSVRTLHHYDDIGLVVPSGRSAAGYRQYDASDVARLYSVLFYRELGFALDDIRRVLDEPGVDELQHLRRQRALVDQRIAHLQSMATALDEIMEARTMYHQLTPEQQREIFGDNWLGEDYAAEAAERWGDTEAWKQSRQAAAARSPQDWADMKARTDALESDCAAAMADGVVAGSDRANALAERHRALIGEHYDCDHDMHVTVTSLYVTDERFTAHYERVAPGLAQWLVDAAQANAARQRAAEL